MDIRRTARFLSQTLAVGLAAAIVLVVLLPESKRQNPVVEMKEAQLSSA